jgi:hypothetical protein
MAGELAASVASVEAWALVVPGHSRLGRMSGRCRRLVERAAELAEREPALRAVVFSGWSPLGGPSEAEQMLSAWPGRRDVELVAEPTAATTAQNAARTLPLLLDRGLRRAAVVCAPLHAPRVRYLFAPLYGRFGVRCAVHVAWAPPTPPALLWELAALSLARRQRRTALAEMSALADA